MNAIGGRQHRNPPTKGAMRPGQIVALAVPATAAAVGAMLIPAGSLGLIATIPAVIAGAVVVHVVLCRARSAQIVAISVGLAGAVSVGATVVSLVAGRRGDIGPGIWGPIEVGALLILVAVGVRWAAGAWAWLAVALAVCGQVGWVLRFIPDRRLSVLITGCALWSIGSLTAAVVAAYPRYTARRLRKTVAQEKEAQRRQLERDLHDYVAHDLSGIVVQAQAAQFASIDDPSVLLARLVRIEHAAQRAMSALDRSIQLLRDVDSDERRTLVTQPTLNDLRSTVAAFAETTTAQVTLTDGDDVADLPPEVSVRLYRIAVESLTNIRRHAPESTEVMVELSRDRRAGTVDLSVTNTVTSPPRPSVPQGSGGTGLVEAAALVTTLGGTLTAGPNPSGWALTATVPVSRYHDGI